MATQLIMKFTHHASRITHLLLLLCALAFLSMTFTGCNTTQQTIAYKSLYSVERVTTAAFDGYLDSVIAGQTSTNSLPRVGSAYNKFHASFLVALDAVQFNTNALAPASLVVESQDVLNLIVEVKGR